MSAPLLQIHLWKLRPHQTTERFRASDGSLAFVMFITICCKKWTGDSTSVQSTWT